MRSLKDKYIMLHKYGKLHQKLSCDVRDARTFLKRKRVKKKKRKRVREDGDEDKIFYCE